MRKPRTCYRPEWTPEETAIVAELYPQGKKAELLARLPMRPWKGIQLHAAHRGIRSQFGWPPESIARLRELYPLHGAAHAAAELGYSVGSVYQKAYRLHIPGPVRVAAPKPVFTPKGRKPRPSVKFIGPREPNKHQQARNAADARRRAAAIAKAERQAAKPVRAPRVAAPKGPKKKLGRPVQPSRTPNLDVQLEKRRTKETVRVSVSAEEIRRLPANDPQRRIYAIGGRDAVVAYRLQQAA